jgi:hypothetical protein
MTDHVKAIAASGSNIVKAEGEEPIFQPGDQVRIATRFPTGVLRIYSITGR